MESDVITLQDIFVAKPPDDDAPVHQRGKLLTPLQCVGLKPHFLEKLAANGVVLPTNFFERDENEYLSSVTAQSYRNFA
jgi:pilus assembly protein CpaF